MYINEFIRDGYYQDLIEAWWYTPLGEDIVIHAQFRNRIAYYVINHVDRDLATKELMRFKAVEILDQLGKQLIGE